MIDRQVVREHIVTWVDRAIDVQDGAVRAHVAGVRESVPDGATDDVGQALESQYLAAVSGSGAVVGGAASVPGLGTGLAVGLSVAETVAFLDATALFTLAIAESRGCPISDLARRRALLLLALLGDDAVALVPRSERGEIIGWGLRLNALADDSVAEVNRVAEKWLITRFGPRQTLFVLGRLAPFGIGAAVGAAGNAVTAKGVIARVRTAFAGHVPEPPAGPETAVTLPEATPNGVSPANADVVAVPPPAGKYAGLFTLLSSRPGERVEVQLSEIDAVVNGGLPATARRSPGWWTNQPGPRAVHASAWLAAGLHISGVDLDGDAVHFSRGPAPLTTDPGAQD